MNSGQALGRETVETKVLLDMLPIVKEYVENAYMRSLHKSTSPGLDNFVFVISLTLNYLMLKEIWVQSIRELKRK